jgi:hypothetical protein
MIEADEQQLLDFRVAIGVRSAVVRVSSVATTLRHRRAGIIIRKLQSTIGNLQLWL